ncbi:MAG: GUN4 domain-containing protein [Nostoc sp.]|uniref:GUN4 domain-containing protein n=1 Tax=Nostoc sp. TaxID=1180 RepID=UPI002FFAB32C
MNQPQFDVFLAHNSQDKPQVRAIASYLKQRSLRVWLDEEQIYGGDTPYREIEKALCKSKSVVFVIGSSGPGRWQGNLELPIIVDLVINSNLRLIPVLLPGIKEIPAEANYRFLRTKSWIDFKTIDDNNALIMLYKSICRSVQIEREAVKTDDLSSEKGINYTRLRDLLAVGNWKNADYETYLVMLQAVGREENDFIRNKELLNFPCTDLRTIDSLWVKYSNGRFGFSVQKKIYLSVGGKPDGKYYREAWPKFGDHIGWRVSNSWISYKKVTFNTSAPVGHLPILSLVFGFAELEGTSTSLGGTLFPVYSFLAQRLVKCNIKGF